MSLALVAQAFFPVPPTGQVASPRVNHMLGSSSFPLPSPEANMATLQRRLLTLLATAALVLAIGCGKSEPTKSGPPEGYQGSKGGLPGGIPTPTKP